jgi:hypothetical protein
MKQGFKLFIILTVLGIGLASIGQAATYGGSYRAPTVSAPGDNIEVVPITESAIDQTKEGSLTVTTFIARAAAWIHGQTFFGGYLRGGNVMDINGDATLLFGDDTANVSLKATGTIASTQTFQTDTLVPTGGSTWSYVCADTNGQLIPCPDLCTNIAGTQPTVPEGTIEDGGLCMIDVIGSAPTTCQYQVLVRKLDTSHVKVTLQQGGAVYLYTPAAGDNVVYVTVKLDNGTTQVIPAPKGQLSSYDLNTTTNHLAVLGVQPATINGGEVCWSGY